MPTIFPAFVDQTGPNTGTPLNAVNLNSLVIDQTFLISGGIASPSGNLILTQPATKAVIITVAGPAIAYVSGPSNSVTLIATNDNYVDMDTTGAYFVISGAVGFTPAAPVDGRIRLYKATTNATVATSITPLALPQPIDSSSVSADPLEAASVSALPNVPSVRDTTQRIRGAINTLVGTGVGAGSFANSVNNNKKAVLGDGANFATSVNGNFISTVVPPASPNYGLFNLGTAPFDGVSVNHFRGVAAGTYIAVNSSGSFTGNLIDLQSGGNSYFYVDQNGLVYAHSGFQSGGPAGVPLGANSFYTPYDPSTVNSAGMFSIGGGPFDGVSLNHYVGASTGTYLAINTFGAFSGDFANFQVAGVSKFKVTSSGITLGASSNVNFANSGTNGLTGSFSINITGTGGSNNPLYMPLAPQGAGATANIYLGNGTLASFVGNSNGTYIGVNAAPAFTGDYINFQSNGTTFFKVDGGGSVTASGSFLLFGGGNLNGTITVGDATHPTTLAGQTINLSNLTTTTSAPGAGGAGALPATPTGYVTISIGGVARKMAYY